MTVSKHSKSTLADVAAAAGVSRSTASRALNDSPRISESTKKRIRAVARQINFVPNAQGRALAVGRSETIAMLVTEPLGELFSDPTYGAFLGGITEQLAESAYLPILLQASSDHERERVLRHLARHSVDAVIDISPYKGSELLDTLRDLHIPTVLCGQLEGHPYRDVFSTVYSDDVEGAGLAADAMRRRGRRNLVAILGPRDNPAVVDRLLGYRGVLGDEALPDDRVVYTGWGASDGFLAMRHLLDRVDAVDGLLAGSDRIASGAIEAMRERGISVPRDVSVVGFDDHPIAQSVSPKLTTVRQPLRHEGRVAAQTALQMIDGAEPSTIVLHMALIERASPPPSGPVRRAIRPLRPPRRPQRSAAPPTRTAERRRAVQLCRPSGRRAPGGRPPGAGAILLPDRAAERRIERSVSHDRQALAPRHLRARDRRRRVHRIPHRRRAARARLPGGRGRRPVQLEPRRHRAHQADRGR